MDRLTTYLNEYSDSHQNKTNVLIHKFSVPAILFSVLGILKALPVPAAWPLWLDWSVVLLAFMFAFYASFKNLKIFVSMVAMTFFMMLTLELLRPRFFLLSLFIFIIAWIFQVIGHKIEGNKPSFTNDIFFLLIGPLWVMKKVPPQKQ